MGGIDRSLIAAAPISDAGGQVPGDDAAVQGGDDSVNDGDGDAILVIMVIIKMVMMLAMAQLFMGMEVKKKLVM